MKSFEFEATGTHWKVDVDDVQDVTTTEKAVIEIVRNLETKLSRFQDESLVSKLSTTLGKHPVDKDIFSLLKMYQQLYKITNGAFTPFIGTSLVESGYDQNYSFVSKTLTNLPKWNEVLEIQNSSITILKPTQLDFGAAGKGYIIDQIANYLTDINITKFCIDGGQDLYIKSVDKPWIIGLENPNDSSLVLGTVQISNGAICGSSGNRRKWGNYHHIINGNSLISPKDILATWVTAQSAIIADALSTALFLTDTKALSPYFTFEYLVLYKDFSIQRSQGFEAQLF